MGRKPRLKLSLKKSLGSDRISREIESMAWLKKKDKYFTSYIKLKLKKLTR